MAMLPAAFQAEEHEEMGNFDPIPANDYNLKVVESEMVLTKKAKEADDPNKGQYLKLKLEVMDGAMKGRFIYRNLNLINPSPKAVEIAQKELATICKAVGLVSITDSAELHEKPMIGKVTVSEGDAAYGPSNDIKNYKPYAGPSSEASPEPGEKKTAGTAAAAGGKKKKAWD